jgi:hypothetical protein
MHENFRLTKRDTWIARIWQILGDLDDSSHLANTGRFGRSYQHNSSRTFGASRNGTSNKKCEVPVIRSRTETKLRGVQNNEVRTSSGAARICL